MSPTTPMHRRRALLCCALCALLCAPLSTGCVSIFSADEGGFVEGAEDGTSNDTSGADSSGTSGADGTSGTSSGGDTSPDGQDGTSDGFTSPVITIEPAQPYTLDDLTAVITQEATHTTGGPVTYTFAWTRDDQAVDGLSPAATVDDAFTGRGEVWTVTVTPSLTDGSATGAPVTASVTIQNTLPVVRSASLDTYRPFASGEVNVRIGEVYDADGDTVAPVIRWFKNDTALTVTGAKLNLAAQTWAEGDTLRVEVSAYDNAGGQIEGPALVIGPMPVNQPGPHWRPLFPSFVSSDGPGGTLLHDPFNSRTLFISRGLLWEAVTPAPGEPLRWVALNPTALEDAPPNSSPFFFYPVIAFDEGSDYKRILFIGAAADTTDVGEGELFQRMRVIELDVTHRGAERWIDRSPLLGETPPFALVPSTLHDRDRERLLIFGGLGFGGGNGGANTVYNDLWSLDLSLRGGEQWVPVETTNEMPARGGALWIKDTDSDQTLLVGGFGPKDTGGGTDNFEYLSDVWSVDLSAPTPTFTPLLTAAPGNVGGTLETYGQPDAANLIISTSAAEGHKLWRYDFDSQTFAAQPTTSNPSASDGLQLFSAYVPPGAGGMLLTTLVAENNDDGMSAHVLNANTGAWIQIAGLSLTPGALKKTLTFSHNRERDAVFVHGGYDDRRGMVRDVLWRFDLLNQRWSQVTVAPDPNHGTPPARYGHGGYQGQAWNDPTFFSGVGDGVELTDAWRLLVDATGGPRWLRLDNPTPEPNFPTPPPREGHARISDCYSDAAFFGGHPPSQPYMGIDDGAAPEHYTTSCTRVGNYDVSCSWTQRSFQSSPPSAQAYPAVALLSQSGRQTIYFGGSNSRGTVEGTLHVLDNCWDWSVPDVGSVTPPARAGASLVLDRRTEDQATVRLYMFGGSEDPNGYNGLDDLWLLERTTAPDGTFQFRWQQVQTTGPSPGGRVHHGAVWDGVRNQMVVFGGDRFGDIWAFIP